jgi:hypothetical protein
MPELNRRECLRGMLTSVAATAAPSLSVKTVNTQANQPTQAGEEKIKICLVWGNRDHHLVRLSEQIGVTHAIAGTADALARVSRS